MVQIGMQHPVRTQRQNQKDESADQAPASNHGRHKSERSGMEFPAEQRGKKGMAGLGKGPSWRHTVGDREEAHVRVLARRQIVQC